MRSDVPSRYPIWRSEGRLPWDALVETPQNIVGGANAVNSFITRSAIP